MNSFFPRSPRSQLGSVASDVEYQLCKSYMKHAGDQLVQKEMQLMMETNLLLESFSQALSRRPVNHFESSKDLSTTFQSHTLDFLLNEEDEPNKSHKSKPFTRKGLNSTVSFNRNNKNKTIVDSSLSFALEDVKENCSRRTVTAFNTLVSENKRMEARLAQVESKKFGADSRNRLTRSKGEVSAHTYQQTILLTAKNAKLQKENQYLNKKIMDLEGKLGKFKQDKETSFLSSSSSISSQVDAKNLELDKKLISDLKTYFEERETLLKTTAESIKQCSDAVLQCIQGQFIDQGCQKCCSLMKKIKASLMGYRQCLEEQITAHSELYACSRERLSKGQQCGNISK